MPKFNSGNSDNVTLLLCFAGVVLTYYEEIMSHPSLVPPMPMSARTKLEFVQITLHSIQQI